MGSRGPVPKRAAERRRTNSKAPETVEVYTPRPRIPRADPNWEPLARDWYRSLGKSGQAAFYEPSDWAQARYLAELMSRTLRSPKVPAALVSTVLSGMTDLLTSEGARRRIGLELAHKTPPAAGPNVTVMDDYRNALTAG